MSTSCDPRVDRGFGFAFFTLLLSLITYVLTPPDRSFIGRAAMEFFVWALSIPDAYRIAHPLRNLEARPSSRLEFRSTGSTGPVDLESPSHALAETPRLARLRDEHERHLSIEDVWDRFARKASEAVSKTSRAKPHM